jgi:hypothetical protein
MPASYPSISIEIREAELALAQAPPVLERDRGDDAMDGRMRRAYDTAR